MNIVKRYSNGEVTIVWKPALCCHSAICVNGLPKVFLPNERPWINPMAAPTEELKRQCDECPTGALSWYMNADGPGEGND